MYVSVRPQDQVGGYESEEIHFTNAKTIENANLELLASFSRKNCSVLRAYGTLKKIFNQNSLKIHLFLGLKAKISWVPTKVLVNN